LHGSWISHTFHLIGDKITFAKSGCETMWESLFGSIMPNNLCAWGVVTFFLGENNTGVGAEESPTLNGDGSSQPYEDMRDIHHRDEQQTSHHQRMYSRVCM
jgi:hypothetical protein